MSQVKRDAHDAPAITGDAPTPAARDLGDQAVSPESTKNTADFGTRFLGIRGAMPQVRRGGQLLADVAIREAAQAMIAVHDALE